MDKMILEQWFIQISAHAQVNYELNGWDCFVECVDLADFVETCERLNLDTVDKAFNEYKEWCEQKADQREEQYAMAREGW
jgi:hypothetical protein